MKSVIVTGVSKGLGAKIAENFLAKGYRVFGISRNAPENSQIIHFKADVGDYQALQKISNELKNQEVSAVINSAGVASMNLALLTPPEVTERIIHVNLLGTIYSCQNFAKLLIRNGGGSIVNFSTIAVQIGLKGESVYVASKAGVEGFTRTFAREMSEFSITVNCIAPGPIDTNLIKGVSEKQIDRIIHQQIFQKKCFPQDVANIAMMLCSDEAKLVSGEVISVGGS